MFSYGVYGLGVRSDIPLPELIPCEGARLDLQVRLGCIEPRGPAPPDGATCLWATADEARLRYRDASFCVRGGRDVVVEPAPGADERAVRLLLLGPALAVALHQRGLLVLHASAVDLGGSAVAFLGEKGEGKSTTAAAFYARGRRLVSDDVVAVDPGRGAGGVPVVYPAFPQLKLWAEAATRFGAATDSLNRLHPDLDKFGQVAAAGFQTDPLPLGQIYVLAEADREAIEPLTPSHAFMELVRHSFVLSLVERMGAAEGHFRQVADVAARVSVRRLSRRRSLEALDDVVGLVENDVAVRPS